MRTRGLVRRHNSLDRHHQKANNPNDLTAALPVTTNHPHSPSTRRRRKPTKHRHTQQQMLLRLLLMCATFCAATSYIIWYSRGPASHWRVGPLSPLAAQSYHVSFPTTTTNNKRSLFSTNNMEWPYQLSSKEQRDAHKRDFGNLDIRFLEDTADRTRGRVIYHDFKDDQNYDLIYYTDDDDENDYYYNFDDDAKRNPYVMWDDKTLAQHKQCRRTNWHRDLPMNCNSLHEFDIERRFRLGESKYLGAGSYREVYMTRLSQPQPPQNVVFKSYYWGADYSNADFEFMRMDAIVAERLTFSNRIVDIYGYCGTGMINEAMINGDMEDFAVPNGGRIDTPLKDEHQLDIRNTISPQMKLKYALDMVESVALLHGWPDGIIVHDDIQLSQFLLTSNNQTLKLNDFNRAEIMLYNEKDQDYCRYKNTPGHGDWRAPEEYYDKPLNEKIDVWSLGNNFYSLLTGGT